MKRSFLTSVLVLAFSPLLFAVPPSSSLCIAPAPELSEVPQGQLPPEELSCSAQRLSFRLDSLPAKPWPIKESIRFDGLDPGVRHRVVVVCGRRAEQSFFFRYSDYKTSELCLFINDLYRTVQLWKSKDAPWCKCR